MNKRNILFFYERQANETRHYAELFRNALLEIEDALEKIKDMTFEEAVEALHGDNKNDDMDGEFGRRFDFDTVHTTTTVVFENDKFSFVGPDIDLYDEEIYDGCVAIVGTFEDLQRLVLPPNVDQVIAFLRNVQSNLVGVTVHDEADAALQALESAIMILEDLEEERPQK